MLMLTLLLLIRMGLCNMVLRSNGPGQFSKGHWVDLEFRLAIRHRPRGHHLLDGRFLPDPDLTSLYLAAHQNNDADVTKTTTIVIENETENEMRDAGPDEILTHNLYRKVGELGCSLSRTRCVRLKERL